MPNELNFGVNLDDFPLGLFDDFDGAINSVAFEKGDYGTQIALTIIPAEYEYDPRNLDTEDRDDPNKYQKQWYGMGSGSYEVSPSGLEAKGPQPNRNTKAVKLIIALKSKAGIGIEGSDLSALIGADLHWKGIEESYRDRDTGETRTSSKLFPTGVALGFSKLGS